MNDTEFLANLEACRLPAAAFNHAGHVRLGYLCLREQEFPAALVRVRGLIKNYANSIGKGSLYDEAITVAFLKLIHEHLRSRGDPGGWEAFKDQNPQNCCVRMLCSGHRETSPARNSGAHTPCVVCCQPLAPVERPVPATVFGSAYFRKFYLNPTTRVVSPAEMRVRGRLIAAILGQAAIPVRRIIDAGCGIGLLRKAFADELPRARYEGLEASEYLCKRYGWTHGSVIDYVPRTPADLVVCYDVLQYLDERAAARAISNLARMTRAALYVSALTREDWRDNCDRTRTDRAVHLRPGDWYRRRLKRNFHYLGFGVWLRKDVTALLWDMERTKA